MTLYKTTNKRVVESAVCVRKRRILSGAGKGWGNRGLFAVYIVASSFFIYIVVCAVTGPIFSFFCPF